MVLRVCAGCVFLLMLTCITIFVVCISFSDCFISVLFCILSAVVTFCLFYDLCCKLFFRVFLFISVFSLVIFPLFYLSVCMFFFVCPDVLFVSTSLSIYRFCFFYFIKTFHFLPCYLYFCIEFIATSLTLS
jgi:hypothetical protein